MAGITWFHSPSTIESGTRKALFSGTVVSEERFGSYHRLRMHLEEVEINNYNRQIHMPVQVFAPHTDVYLGAQLQVRGYLRSARTQTDQISLSGSIYRTDGKQSWPWNIVRYLRMHIENVFQTLFKDEHKVLATGLVIGGSGNLTPSLKNVFMRAGILHILAVSGLHIGFVCLFGYALFSITFLPRSLKFFGVMCLVICYIFLTSFRPSVCRASFMVLLFGGALLLQRNVKRLHIVNLAAITLLIYDPFLLYSLSAQLSFAAVYGIVYFYPKIHEVIVNHITWKPLRIVCMSLAVSCSAQLFVAPLIVHYFKRISLIAPVSNLLVVPITTCIVFMLYVAILLHALWSGGAQLIAMIVQPLFDLLISTARVSAGVPFSAISLSIPVSILLCTWGLFVSRARKYAVLIILLLLCLHSAALLSKRVLITQYKNIVLLNCPDHHTICYCSEQINPGELARIMKTPDQPHVDYAIAPSVEPGIAEQWIPSPEAFTILHVQYGDIELHIDSALLVCYGDKEFIFNDKSAIFNAEHAVIHQVSNGRKTFSNASAISGTLFDDVITELWLMGVQCLLLF